MTTRHFLKFSIACLSFVFMGASCISFNNSGSANSVSGDAGMFVSTDKGENWQKISTAPTVNGIVDVSGVSVYRLVSDPQDPAALYWASRSAGLLFSYDKGKSWQRAAVPLNEGFIFGVVVHPTDKCTLYATNGGFLYKTTDCSRSWTEVYREAKTDVKITGVTIHNFAPYEIIAAQDNGTILKSIDGGKSWQVTKRFKEKGLRHIISNPLQEGVIYAAFDKKGLAKSTDTGETWEFMNDGLEKFSKAKEFRRMSLHPFKANVVYWISDYGILLSEDGGVSWQEISLITSPGSAKIYGFAVNPNNDDELFYTATIENRSTLYKTVDGGTTWITKRLPSGQIPTALYMEPENELLYLGFTIAPSQ
ncbi:MAG: hypothetical protein GW939_02980 [Candidatus Magasanikbacteria bacterium]|uniref:Uncharacterized protein n=1 Tax=Candidatus Magasanikbacteria bacterium CG10_big_fil_rev_8_21_14_0_10_38_6 TaxID=1974647 RepID=A0A2M6P0M0_9BACT|nr:hypothetical protein [Candidatus Magasanikbacteria bacterium]NCS71715.1 hypothetical protein [Candidatus Magasanikbacteria bacterium]PIR77282.1 MAG: hypothetical protein COU30_03340 [Candidatus Magasanikbacteria bacterium CG10_big_fil_rev_8_21_14_0_10_38_6]